MFHRQCFLILTFLLCHPVLAQETFRVFGADATNQQILSVAVTTTDKIVTAKLQRPQELPFAVTSLAKHSDNRLVIASSAAPTKQGRFSAASLTILGDGTLQIDHVAPLDGPTGYTSIDRKGRYFLFANYKTGNIGTYRIDDQHHIGESVSSTTTPNAEAHCILTTPDNRFVYVPCVKNNNALFQYAFDQQTGKLTPLKPFNALPPAMFGPRHVAYHPTLPIAYFSNEQQLGVSVYEIGVDGQLSDKQHAITMPRRLPFEQGKRDLHAADIVVTPDGRCLLVAVRDFNGDEDSVFSFRIESDGRLSQIGRTKVGDIPWKLNLSPDGKFLLVSESGDHQLAIYRIRPDGPLIPAAKVEWAAAVRDMVVHPSR